MKTPIDSAADRRLAPVPCSAWELYRSLREEFGATRLHEELYQWFVADAKTLSYGYAGTLRLLALPEGLAVRVMRHTAKRLAGKKTWSWRQFVKQNA